MNSLGDAFHVEPAVVTGIVAALLGVLVSFGVPITEDQQNAILKLFVVVVPVVMALVIRRKVTPNKTVEDAGLSPDAVKQDAQAARAAAKGEGA